MTSTNIQNSNLILEYDIYATHFLEAGVSTLTDVAVNTNLALKKRLILKFLVNSLGRPIQCTVDCHELSLQQFC